jgi:hypothetical protein
MSSVDEDELYPLLELSHQCVLGSLVGLIDSTSRSMSTPSPDDVATAIAVRAEGCCCCRCFGDALCACVRFSAPKALRMQSLAT